MRLREVSHFRFGAKTTAVCVQKHQTTNYTATSKLSSFAHLQGSVVESAVRERHDELRACASGEKLEGQVRQLRRRPSALEQSLHHVGRLHAGLEMGGRRVDGRRGGGQLVLAQQFMLAQQRSVGVLRITHHAFFGHRETGTGDEDHGNRAPKQ